MKLDEKLMAGQKPEIILSDGCWVAGGAIRRWFTGEKQTSDIDVFSINDESEQNIITANSLIERIRNDRMVMFTGSPIQIIRQPRFTTAQECIEHFDYTICQFAWDGEEIITTIEAVISCLRKHLAVNKIQEGYEIDSLRRAFKYYNTGYKPCIGTIREIAKALNLATSESIEKFNDISPYRWD